MEIPANFFKIALVLNLVLVLNIVNASPNNDLDAGDICVLNDNDYGICKEIIECDYAKQLFRQRKNAEIMSYRCRFRGRMPYVCCPSSVSRIDEIAVTGKIVEVTTNKATTTTEKSTTPVQQTDDLDDEVETTENEKAPLFLLTTTEETSTAALRASGQTRFQKALCENETPEIQLGLNIIGGERADIGEFPFQAAIGYRKISEGETTKENSIKYLCGGSLIADDVVISAAHCFVDRLNPAETVKLGRVRIFKA